jgi:hypothetical protein
MGPVYKLLAEAAGSDDAMYSHLEDTYLLPKPDRMAWVLATAPNLYKKVGL